MFNISKLVYFPIKEHFRKLTKFISVTVNEKCFIARASAASESNTNLAMHLGATRNES